MALSADGTTLLSGGSDGHVRKYDVYASMNGKAMLTQNVRHPFVDGVVRAGVLSAWWANEEIPLLKGEEEGEDENFVSPVHSLAIQQESLWGLSGTESGNINLCSLRHEPGQVRHVLRKHTSAVSALLLTNDDTELISGGWDRGVHQWDLNTGQVVRSFPGHAGQISSLSLRPFQLGQSMTDFDARSPSISILASAGSPASRKVGMERSQSAQSVNTPSTRGGVTSATNTPAKNKSPLKQQIAALNATQMSLKLDQEEEAEDAATKAESLAGGVSAKATPYATPHEPQLPTPAREATGMTPATPSKQSKETDDSLFGEGRSDDMELERDLNEALGLGVGDHNQGKAGDGMVGMDDGEELKGPDRPSTSKGMADKDRDADSDGDSLFGADSADGDADADGDLDADGDADADGEYDLDAEGEDEDAEGEDDDAPLAARFTTTKTATPNALELPGSGTGISETQSKATSPLVNGKDSKSERKSALPKPAFGGAEIAAGFDADTSKFSNDILLTSTLGGQVTLWDKRVPSYTSNGSPAKGVRALILPEKTPPWCMAACWSSRGDKIYVGRRNETIDEWDLRMIPDADTTTASNGAAIANDVYSGRKGNARFSRSLKFPAGSGPVTAVAAMPNNRHIVCGSYDNVRIWDTQAIENKIPFRIVAGHHGATVSQIIVDPTCRFLFTSSGDRGWLSTSTEAVLLHEIQVL
jgi:transcriptional activator SPT8